MIQVLLLVYIDGEALAEYNRPTISSVKQAFMKG
jgi:hypothetical protein